MLAEVNAPEVRRVMQRAAGEPSYTYPWPELEQEDRASFPCVGYGSLVNAASARRTLGGSLKGLVIAFGVRRLFNLPMSADALKRYSSPATPTANAALNVLPTHRFEDVVNGALFDVMREDIPAFREREIGYDLVPVACVDWSRRTGAPFVAYVLAHPGPANAGAERTVSAIAPHAGYYQLCREGAASMGEEFLEFWSESTFLADGTTSIDEWERRR